MRPNRLVTMLCLLMLFAGTALAADAPQDQRKHTKLGKYLLATEAYDMWHKAPGKTFVIDVRTVEEYSFLGHPAMAANIPFQLWTGIFDPQKKVYALAPNPHFVDAIKRTYKPGDALLLVCRSGHRSAAAVNVLAEAGFTNVYSVVDGFEGDAIADKGSPHFGQRLKDGWRNSTNPWTTDLDVALVYNFGK